MNILIVEDDIFLASRIKEAFLKYGYINRVKHISSYDDYLYENYNIKSFDIVLLDINLSKSDKKEGFKILSQIRESYYTIPVIIISASDEYLFLEEAFARGAHDYMVKPFRNRELQIRIERWFRNYVFSEYFSINKIVEYWGLTYDLTRFSFYWKWKEIKLSKGSKYILSLFMIYKEELITRDFLIWKIWGYAEEDYEKNLRIKVMRLKKQLREYGFDTWIKTIRGEWYIFRKCDD